MDATQLRENTSSERALLRAVLAINRNKNSEDFGPAIDHIDRTRCAPLLLRTASVVQCDVAIVLVGGPYRYCHSLCRKINTEEEE